MILIAHTKLPISSSIHKMFRHILHQNIADFHAYLWIIMFSNVIQEMWKQQKVISEQKILNSDFSFNNASIISNFLLDHLENMF